MRDWREEIRSVIAPLNLEATREAEIMEELSLHLRDRSDELLVSGMSEEQVDEALIQELHSNTLTAGLQATIPRSRPFVPVGREENGRLLSRTWMDLRYGARLLLQNAGFAIVVILSLALGIGANTAIFQLLNAVRLRSLPVKNPERLATVRIVDSPHCCRGDFYSDHPDLTGAVWNQLREQQQGFSEIAAWYPTRQNLSRGGEARYSDTLIVSGNFFKVLGVQQSLGRLITPADDYRGCGAQGAVVSYGFWQREFGGLPGVLGNKVSLNNHPFQIIGVTPPNFSGVEVGRNFDVAIPLCSEAIFSNKGSLMDSPVSWWITTIGRLKPGWTLERASAQLAAISPGMFAETVPAGFDSQERKDYLSFRLGALPAATGFSRLRKDYEEPLWLLLALSGLVLLIACANLANLMLARASVRQREMALRLTLGASRSRLIWQLLTESLLLAALAAIAGAAVAQILSRAMVTFLSTQQESIFLELTPDWRVLSFVTALAGLACVLFGLTPAIKASQTEPGVVLKATGRGFSASGENLLLRRVLVVSQVALSLVLLMSALLFARTFQNLAVVNAGFQEDHLLVANFDYSPLKLDKDSQMAFRRDLLARIQAIPGVSSAAETLVTPLSHSGWDDNVDIPDGPQRQDVLFNRVSPGFFETMKTPLLAGRDFNRADTPVSPRAAIVNRTFARRFFGDANPVGREFYDSGKPEKPYQVIGVVTDTKYYSLREDPAAIVFLSFTQANGPEEHSTLLIRSNEALPSLISSIKGAARKISSGMALDFSVLKTQIREGLLRERLMATLSGFFGVLATILAMIGLYGVISYWVIRRRNEIGLRMALGANRADILVMVLREAAILLGVGLAIGSGLALAAGNLAGSMLYGLKPRDPSTLAAAIAGMGVVALAASLVPAQRAASVDPMSALREE